MSYSRRAGDPASWIPKEALQPGRYRGKCRNASEAEWDGESFTYTRHKFGSSYIEALPCPEDDEGFDVFFPLEKL